MTMPTITIVEVSSLEPKPMRLPTTQTTIQRTKGITAIFQYLAMSAMVRPPKIAGMT